MKVKLKSDDKKVKKSTEGVTWNPMSYNKEYTVLEICIYYKIPSPSMGRVMLTLCDDEGHYTTESLELFEVTDPRPSKYWKLEFSDISFGLFLPDFDESNKNFEDEVTDYEPEALKRFDEIVKKMEDEFKEQKDTNDN